MSATQGTGIRTPDQRIRVFVSSVLHELADERLAVRGAIESLRMAPVMLELGARPHPARDLYRAYLEQSDVFVGIYGDRYGWIPPGEEVSGLEDEYDLAPDSMPRLVYIASSASREPRLNELLARIRDDDAVSYTSFDTPEQLRDLVQADLATLLAERFDQSRRRDGHTRRPSDEAPIDSRVPPAYSRLIGRDDDVAAVVGLLSEPGTRLVTLAGPGGIGKSRLAIAVADAATALFPGGTVFVPLENVLEPDLLLPTIGYALGVRESGALTLEERLNVALGGRRMLLVLDNFEQLTAAAPILVRLFTIAPDAAFLVTSRAVLRIRGERVFEVEPLETHDPASPDSIARSADAPAVELFVERARSASPGFAVTADNLGAIVAICRALEGVPLAIELAAARSRLLSPRELLARLDRVLPLLVESARDLPARQRTLRSTIEWSTRLLEPSQRTLLWELCVFSPGFVLESIEALGARREWGFDVYDALAALVDASLVAQDDQDGGAVFSLLGSVREYGVGMLADTGIEHAVRDAHAQVYADLAHTEGALLGTAGQLAAVHRLHLERGNLRAAVRRLVTSGEVDAACEVAWRLFLFWWCGGYILEVSVWLEEALTSSATPVSARASAVVDFYVGWRDMWSARSAGISHTLASAAARFEADGDALGVAMATTAAGVAEINSHAPDVGAAARLLDAGGEAFRTLGVGWGECLALVALGRIALLRGRTDEAADLFRGGAAASAASGETFAGTVATHHVGRMLLADGRLDEAESAFRVSMAGSVALRHEEGIAYCLEGLSAAAAERRDAERAGLLAGAAASIRRRTAAFDAPPFVYHTGYLERLEGADADALARARDRGAEYGAFEAAELGMTAASGVQRGTA